MTIKRIKTVYVAADDVPACATFYEGVLQTTPSFRDGDRWVQFSVDGAAFAVASKAEAGGVSGATAVFEATDQEDHDRLLASGAQMLSERDMGDHGLIRSYQDPAGNRLQLFWRP